MRVLVADDHSLFRDGIVSLLEAAGFEVVDQVGDGRQAVDSARAHRPDLVLLDIAMPGKSGIDTLREIKADLPEIKVVILTVSDEDADIISAVRGGADGYLLKNLNADQFIEMLNDLRAGKAAITRATTAQLMKALATEPALAPSIEEDLTDREQELLNLVAQGLSNRAIAHSLAISENTVKYHMKNILGKLDVQNRAEAVARAIHLGLIDADTAGSPTSSR
jgi:DNA-binding NarL/FixJ family response regulator